MKLVKLLILYIDVIFVLFFVLKKKVLKYKDRVRICCNVWWFWMLYEVRLEENIVDFCKNNERII